MALTAKTSFMMLGILPIVLAAPALTLQSSILSLSTTKQMTNAGVYDIETILLSPPSEPSSTGSTSGAFISYSASTTEEATTTVTFTEDIPTTITVTASPTTITEIITITASATTPSPPPSSSTTGGGLGPAKSIWFSPTNLSDLSSFQVSKYAGGQNNLQVVSNVPSNAKDKSSSVSVSSDPNAPPPSPSILQVLFPAGSIDPGQKTKPRGGAEFYASPIPSLPSARNVTLQYSVFFPSTFDWVLAGKLPGMYGGHTGCSGGNPATDCFSTRLMWRKGGQGELYLYAPKEKQTSALCAAPGSVCDAAYGFSIGRGSFLWKAGGWTTIQQTIFLNTPGKNDGVFTLDVNGERVIERNDVLYRDSIEDGGGKAGGGSGNGRNTSTKMEAVKTTTTKHAKPRPTPAPTSTTTTEDGGLLGLGPLLGGLLGALRRDVGGLDVYVKEDPETSSTGLASPTAAAVLPLPTPQPTTRTPQPSQTVSATPSEDPSSSGTFGVESAKETDIKFVGIFFSTFFGGHEDKYATPKDQYVWFKDFALAHNS